MGEENTRAQPAANAQSFRRTCTYHRSTRENGKNRRASPRLCRADRDRGACVSMCNLTVGLTNKIFHSGAPFAQTPPPRQTPPFRFQHEQPARKFAKITRPRSGAHFSRLQPVPHVNRAELPPTRWYTAHCLLAFGRSCCHWSARAILFFFIT